MDTYTVVAILLGLSILFTGVAGLYDFQEHHYKMTKEHLWNDGLFLAILAVAILLIGIKR